MASENGLVAAIIEVSRELRHSVVPPRGAPYFCLDADATYDLRVFDSLSARGIFRKYEFALEIGSGLGGRARWLAVRHGCRIVGVDSSVDNIAAASLLNRRAHMDDQVLFQVGHLEQMPLRERIFTHVWLLHIPAEFGLADVVREAYRVLRGGGFFALHIAAPLPAQRQELLETLRAIGFADLELRETTLSDTVDACRIARQRLDKLLGSSADEIPGKRERRATHLQIFARRLT